MNLPGLLMKRAPFRVVDVMWVFLLRPENLHHVSIRAHQHSLEHSAVHPLFAALRCHYVYGSHTHSPKLKRNEELIIINNKIIEEFSVGPRTIHFYVWK